MAKGVKTPREDRLGRRREARTERLIAAALAVAAEHGLDGLTIARVAEALDYAPAAVYRYFPSKDALLAELQKRVLEGLLEALDAAIGQTAGLTAGTRHRHAAALAPLLVAVRLYAGFAERHGPRFALLQQVLGDPRPLLDLDAGAPVVEVMGRLLDVLAGRFEAAAEAGALDPGLADERALVYWASVHGVVQLKKLQRFDARRIRPAEQAAQAANALLAGFGARLSTIERAAALAARVEIADLF